ncbi:cysteine--tRNA ligase [Candidatus Bathyarchaeota archaeon]|nr:cysteine--tRNA ligase [Candidatus Bathyarchaeota archaeon]
MLKLYDTLTREKRPFVPLEPGKVRMYVCGPTVYAEPHIGNFRVFVMGDIVRRWMEYRGYDVFYVMNITDIDDKTIRDSGREGVTLKEFTERYTKAFLQGLDRMNIKRATLYPKATEHIDDMIKFIEGLLKKGLAYVASDGVYYDIDKFPEYGKLSRIDLSKVRKTERMLADEYDKESPQDFALWKRSTPEELRRGIYYDSPWGPGRPGWHIECSVMSQKYLGETLDIHMGGEDLIFPHHENEIAQSEGLTGKPFVRYWLHVAFLKIRGEKMSKSLGNIIRISEALREYSPDALRYFYLSAHYRRQIDYTDEVMEGAEAAVRRLGNTLSIVEDAQRQPEEKLGYDDEEQRFLEEIKTLKHRFEASMDDDLDTHGAIDALHAMSKTLNTYAEGRPNKGVLLRGYETYRRLLSTLGLLERREEAGELLERALNLIVEVRERLRAERRYELSDWIREELRSIGVILEDTPKGTRWRIEA